jgi:hypothetical protein
MTGFEIVTKHQYGTGGAIEENGFITKRNSGG